MFYSKTFVVIFFLCFIHACVSKPAAENEITESGGILSSVWGWITYPFRWWSSGETEQPVNKPLVASTTDNPNDIVDIRSHNVTIWCNDQTCTTMKCENSQCMNLTCNIYDTDFRGECREYNITNVVDEASAKPTTTADNVNIQSKPTEIPKIVSSVAPIEKDNKTIVDEHPLELEAVLSSTVNKQTSEQHSHKKEDPTGR